ncbi:hypothetical protein D3C75_1101030 [compost metagenome]
MTMAKVLRSGCLVICDHCQPRGHGFEHHIAKGFGQARKQEQVTAGIVFGQHLATLGAAEHGIRYLLFEGGTLRAVTHHDQAQAFVWISFLQGLQAWAQQTQVLFCRQPPDMQHGDVVRAEPPAFP